MRGYGGVETLHHHGGRNVLFLGKNSGFSLLVVEQDIRDTRQVTW